MWDLDLWDLILGYTTQGERNAFITAGPMTLIIQQCNSVLGDCSQDQIDAVMRICFSPRNQLVLGGPGTGKTYVLRLARLILEWMGVPCHTCAFTGLAARNADGWTINRTLPLYRLDKQWDERAAKPRVYVDHTCDYRVLFVDEISMVGPVMYEQMQYLLRTNNVRVCAMGDFRQLPPVTTPSSGRRYMFESGYIKSFEIHALSTRHRQKDPTFVQIIEKIGRNEYQDPQVRQFLHQRQQAFQGLSFLKRQEILHLYSTNSAADSWNDQCFHRLPGIPATFHPIVTSVQEIAVSTYRHKTTKTFRTLLTPVHQDEVFQAFKHLRSQFTCYKIGPVLLKKNCYIMFTRNIYDLKIPGTDLHDARTIDIVNGTRANVLEILPSGLRVCLDEAPDLPFVFPLQSYRVYFESILPTSEDVDLVVTRRNFAVVRYYPCVQCYALTIHKSQGLTLDKVVLDLGNLQIPNLAYVAVSRCKTRQGIYIQGFRPPQSGIEPRVRAFYEQLGKKDWSRLPGVPRTERVIGLDQALKLVTFRKRGRSEYEVRVGDFCTNVRTKKIALEILYSRSKEHLKNNYSTCDLPTCTRKYITQLADKLLVLQKQKVQP